MKKHYIRHKELCDNQEATRIVFPKNDKLYFTKSYFKTIIPFRTYCDFECMNVPVDKKNVIYKQVPVAVGYYVESDIPEILKSGYYKHFGLDSADWFVKKMKEIENKLFFFFKDTNELLNMTEEDEECFQSSNICWFCEKEVGASLLEAGGRADEKVRDHCHLTGKHRGCLLYKSDATEEEDRQNQEDRTQ